MRASVDSIASLNRPVSAFAVAELADSAAHARQSRQAARLDSKDKVSKRLKSRQEIATGDGTRDAGGDEVFDKKQAQTYRCGASTWTDDRNQATSRDESQTRYAWAVEGMQCPHCQMSIRDASLREESQKPLFFESANAAALFSIGCNLLPTVTESDHRADRQLDRDTPASTAS